jgi:dihydropteroate synthase
MPAKPYRLCWGNHVLDLGHRARIMGIVNVTPDSFSDGGKCFDADKAINQAEQLVEDGADIIDIGGESSRPYSEQVPIEEEARRVIPVIQVLAKRLPVPISIDTTKSEIARRAIDAGASIINDISAMRFDSEIAKVAAQNNTILILMHMKGTPKNMQLSPVYDDLMGEIRTFLNDVILSAQEHGVPKSNIIADPGIGFGKTVSHNLEIINNLDQLEALDVPILLGPSRKAFIRKILIQNDGTELKPDHPTIETGTLAAVAAAVMQGARIVRVHDVANTYSMLKVLDAIKCANPKC